MFWLVQVRIYGAGSPWTPLGFPKTQPLDASPGLYSVTHGPKAGDDLFLDLKQKHSHKILKKKTKNRFSCVMYSSFFVLRLIYFW